MSNESWPNSFHLGKTSTWRSFLNAADTQPRVLAQSAHRRLNDNHRRHCANWWALGITVGLFAGSSMHHPVHGQSIDYLKAGTALLRKRNGAAVLLSSTTQQAPSELEKSSTASASRSPAA